MKFLLLLFICVVMSHQTVAFKKLTEEDMMQALEEQENWLKDNIEITNGLRDSPEIVEGSCPEGFELDSSGICRQVWREDYSEWDDSEWDKK